MSGQAANSLLEQAGIFRNACDLDLFLFFVGHPRSILTSESVATFLGYELKRIAESLEVLIGAGVIRRTQTSAHAARLYVLVTEDTDRQWLPALLEMASTRAGRVLLKTALAPRPERNDSSLTGGRSQMLANAAAQSFQSHGENVHAVVRRVRRRGGR